VETSIDTLLRDTSMGRPHVVILGAGASLATCPKGDANGIKLPLMNNFIETIGLEPLFEEYGINYKGKNFEDIYSDLYENGQSVDIAKRIEIHVVEYFSLLRLPSYPTIYDYLVLSLRKKDVIATFNWDPLLFRACWRNHKYAELPYICYLHGNVIIGYCVKDRQSGMVGERCPKCGNVYEPSKILFPIQKKKYNIDNAIDQQWKALTNVLENAYLLTIYGYGAPKSDVEAIDIMRTAWANVRSRELVQVEIIDTKNESELIESWKDFIFEDHYNVIDNFYKSIIALFPRRSCEAEWNYDMPMKPEFYPQNPIPKELPFPELWKWYAQLTKFEGESA
jgi:hypothetical protein